MKQSFYLFNPNETGQIHVATRKTAQVRLQKNLFRKVDGILSSTKITIKKGEDFYQHEAFFDTDKWTGEPGLWNLHYDGCDYECEGMDGCKKKLLELYCERNPKTGDYEQLEDAEWIVKNEQFEWIL